MATIDSISSINIWYFVGILYMIFLFIYVIFALIIVRQIYLMTHTLNGSLDKSIKTFGYLHFIFSVVVFIIGWIILL